MRVKRGRKNMGSEPNYWQSYSDMMAALMMVFILIMAVAMVSLTVYKKELDESKLELEQKNEELIKRQDLLESQNDELLKLKEALEDKQSQIDRIIGVKQEIIQALKEEFDKEDIDIAIDSETGAIIFDSSILYDTNKSELKPEGESYLDRFLPVYIGVLFREEFREDIAEIIIEGHADTRDTYMYNLGLSQQRAFSVAEYILAESNLDDDQKQQLRSIITANGRSYSHPVYKADGSIDLDKSRRVEVKFRLKDDEMIRELQKLLEGEE